MNYGQQFTLTATVLPAPTRLNRPPAPSPSARPHRAQSALPLLVHGIATLNVTTPLNVGTYNLTANYSGDSNYSGSASISSVIVTVSIVNATLSATIAPTTNVPYGNTATVTATVALPGSNAAPSGTVTAVVEGITGASASATLTPNPGGNTATANININAPTPQTGAYTVSVPAPVPRTFSARLPRPPPSPPPRATLAPPSASPLLHPRLVSPSPSLRRSITTATAPGLTPSPATSPYRHHHGQDPRHRPGRNQHCSHLSNPLR